MFDPRFRNPLRPLALVFALLVLAGPAAACGDDSDDQDGEVESTTETTADGTDTGETDPPEEVDEAAGSFELTTSDGSMAVAGTAEECTIGDDRQSVQLVFSGSSLDVEIDAYQDGGTVTVVGEFEGTVDSLTIGDSGEVAISGRGGIADDSAEPTTFEVDGTCP